MPYPKIRRLEPFFSIWNCIGNRAMLKIDSNPTPKIIVDQKAPAPQAPSSSKAAIKAGTVIVLTPSALKLSRELQAITTDPDKDPAARLDASEKLRALTAQIFNDR